MAGMDREENQERAGGAPGGEPLREESIHQRKGVSFTHSLSDYLNLQPQLSHSLVA
jgi:hypothetical protein